MSTTTAVNVHHEAILEHLETYRLNLEFCTEQHASALIGNRHMGCGGSKDWAARMRDYREKIATLESILTYVDEAS